VQADWEYSDGQNTTSFDQRTAGMLEKAYQDKQTTCAWTGQRGGKHCVTFGTMTYQQSTGKQFTVNRKQHGNSHDRFACILDFCLQKLPYGWFKLYVCFFAFPSIFLFSRVLLLCLFFLLFKSNYAADAF